jgi:transposase
LKAYSADLHQKVLDAALAKRGTRDRIAVMFGVSVRFVDTVLHRHRSGEPVGPRPRHVGQPKIRPEHEPVLRQLVAEQPDATLEELVDALEARGGPRVSRTGMGYALARLKLPRKKSRSTPRSATASG